MGFNIVFMGSPDFALPILNALTDHYLVSGVITQPDKPAGRGKVLTSPPVKELAISRGLPVIQPKRLREPEAMAWLQSFRPDLIVVAAFGQILRADVLELPEFACINVHASLLPRWRGAAPIQATILNGDVEAGVTIMRMDVGVDTGPVLSQRSLLVKPGETAGELSGRLSYLGADLLIETLPGYISGSVLPKPQTESLATRAPMLKKEDGLLNFSNPADYLGRQVRAYNPWPGAFAYWRGETLKVLNAHPLLDVNAISGQRYVIDHFPAFGSLHGLLVLDVVQSAGKKPMTGDVFLRGARGWLNA